MKKFTLAIICSMVAMTVGASAQLKFAIFDMPRAAKEYYKTAQVEAELKADAEKFGGELQKRQETLKEMASKGQELAKQAQSPSASAEARAKFEKEAQGVAAQFRKEGQEARAFEVQQRRALDQKRQRLLKNISDDIREIVVAIGKRDGVNFIFNSNGLGAPLYADGVPDITDEVIRNLNAKKPNAPAGG